MRDRKTLKVLPTTWQIFSKWFLNEGINQYMHAFPSWALELPSPLSCPQQPWEPAIGTSTGTLFTNTRLERGPGGKVDVAGPGGSYFCSRLQTMTMPLASLEARRLSSQLKLTSSTGALWPCSLLTAALAARSTSKKCTHISSLPVTAQVRRRGRQEVLHMVM